MKKVVIIGMFLTGCLAPEIQEPISVPQPDLDQNGYPEGRSSKEDPCLGETIILHGPNGETKIVELPALCQPEDWSSVYEEVSNPNPVENEFEWDENSFQFAI